MQAGRRWISRLLRYAVCAAAITWLAQQTDWAEMKRVWLEADKGLLVLGVFCFWPSVVLISIRLRRVLAVHDIHVSVWRAIMVTFAGNFVANAFPLGTTGGDSVKAYLVARETPHKHEAVMCVLFDRLVGVAGLVMLAGLVLLASWGNPAFAKWGRIIGVLILALVVGGGVYFSNRLRCWFHVDDLISRLPFGQHLQRLDRAVLVFRHHGRCVVECVILTAILQLNSIFCMFLMGWALNLVGDRPLTAIPVYLGYIPIAFLTGALPIGVLEVTLQELLAGAAALGSPEAAISLGLMCRVMQLVWALPGIVPVLQGRPAAGARAMVVEESLEPENASG
ncbi:MAG: flippase-like domain-containing protein [Phycisphaerales bacterium]|nr:flippase-like domain-containing protein [Phycisphaerales bacterium]